MTKKAEGSMKNMVVPVAVIVFVLVCVMTVMTSIQNKKNFSLLEQERYKRLTAEEKLQVVQTHAAKAEADLQAAQEKLNGIDGILQQGNSVAQKLTTELENVKGERDLVQKQLMELRESIGVGTLKESGMAND